MAERPPDALLPEFQAEDEDQVRAGLAWLCLALLSLQGVRGAGLAVWLARLGSLHARERPPRS